MQNFEEFAPRKTVLFIEGNFWEVYANAELSFFNVKKKKQKKKGKFRMKEKVKSLIVAMNKNKAVTRAICFILALIMVFYVIPSTVYPFVAEAFENDALESATADKSDSSAVREFEVIQRRKCKAFSSL